MVSRIVSPFAGLSQSVSRGIAQGQRAQSINEQKARGQRQEEQQKQLFEFKKKQAEAQKRSDDNKAFRGLLKQAVGAKDKAQKEFFLDLAFRQIDPDGKSTFLKSARKLFLSGEPQTIKAMVGRVQALGGDVKSFREAVSGLASEDQAAFFQKQEKFLADRQRKKAEIQRFADKEKIRKSTVFGDARLKQELALRRARAGAPAPAVTAEVPPSEGSSVPTSAPGKGRRTLVDAINIRSVGIIGAAKGAISSTVGQFAPGAVDKIAIADRKRIQRMRQQVIGMFKTSGRVPVQEREEIKKFLPTGGTFTSVPGEREAVIALSESLNNVLRQELAIANDRNQNPGAISRAKRTVRQLERILNEIGDVRGLRDRPVGSFFDAAGETKESIVPGKKSSSGAKFKILSIEEVK